MSVARARIIKATNASASASANAGANANASANASASARRIAGPVVDALVEAARIVAEANAKAEAIVAGAAASAGKVADDAAREAREKELARVTAEVLAARAGEERRAERELEHTIELATALAERLVGEALAVDPARVRVLAVDALRETRGARELRVEACPLDVPVLQELLASLGEGVAVLEPSPELSRGSLVVHTELGRVDARLAPQLDRLAEALREVLRGKGTPP